MGTAAYWALPLLVALGAAIAWRTGLGQQRAIVTASLRATVQLAVVSVVLSVALRTLGGAGAVLLVMLAVAAVTSASRIGQLRAMLPLALAWTGVPTVLVLAALFGSGTLPLRPVALLPAGGIVLGNAMNTGTLAGRRLLAELRLRAAEVEAALSLGFLPRQAVREVLGRQAAAEALVPALDQTRTVGLVTLPGAFVGTVLGGASPAQAGALQLVVLIALLVAGTGSALLATELTIGHYCRDGATVVVPAAR